MFIRFSALLPAAALVAVAAATPSELEARQIISQCKTGTPQCCNRVLTRNDPTVTQLAGGLGFVLPPFEGGVGLGCTPITAIGTGSALCTQQPVCCTDSFFSGLIYVGCTPMNVIL